MDDRDRGRREAAVDWAGDARRTRFAIRDRMRGGEMTLADVFHSATQDALVARLSVLWVLESLPGAGKVATRRKLAALDVDGSLPLSTLDDPITALLLSEFGGPTGDAASDDDGVRAVGHAAEDGA